MEWEQTNFHPSALLEKIQTGDEDTPTVNQRQYLLCPNYEHRELLISKQFRVKTGEKESVCEVRGGGEVLGGGWGGGVEVCLT